MTVGPRETCRHGHAMSGANLYVSPSGLRQCVACRRKRHLAYYEKNRDAAIRRAVEWKRANPERAKEQHRRRYELNRDAVRAENERWREKNPDKVRDIRENRRARERAAFVEHVDRVRVHSESDGLCGICRLPVPLGEMELDHVLPLSRGGKHEYANVQPSHRTCNRRKFNKVVLNAA